MTQAWRRSAANSVAPKPLSAPSVGAGSIRGVAVDHIQSGARFGMTVGPGQIALHDQAFTSVPSTEKWSSDSSGATSRCARIDAITLIDISVVDSRCPKVARSPAVAAFELRAVPGSRN